MNGSEALIKALADAGVDTCFANPGTSEMSLVAALDKEPRIRSVLALFEGVATGAADGYGRMADKPALTLLHLGPGFANGAANLHNARRARSPVLNMVGDHATWHLELDAPLTSDIRGLATPVSDWYGVSESANDLPACGVRALQNALSYPGQIATFVVPADHSWDPVTDIDDTTVAVSAEILTDEHIHLAADALRNNTRGALLLGARALRREALLQAGRIAAATGVRLISETFFNRQRRGVDVPVVERLPYFAEQAAAHLEGLELIMLIGAKAPVSFFAYPNSPSILTPEGATLHELASPHIDALNTLTRLADALNAPPLAEHVRAPVRHKVEEGTIDAISLGQLLNNHIPKDAIVSDEGATNGLAAYLMSTEAEAHDWMTVTGGAIGQGLPLSIGAAIACPDRKVIALEADGSAMYTVQALWTMVREQLDITVLILNNSAYAILNIELNRIGADQVGETARSLLSLDRPDLRWSTIAEGMGMTASTVRLNSELDQALTNAMAGRGPCLIEIILPN